MNFLITDPDYPITGEVSAHFAEDLRRQVAEELGIEVHVEEVDAGPSASIPAYLIEVFSPAADALAILAAPSIIPQALQGWRNLFNQTAACLHRLGLAFAIDVPTATLLAAAALFDTESSTEEIEVVSTTRHWVNLGGPGSDHLRREDLDTPKDTLAKHFAAVKQLDAHYVMLLAQGLRSFTALVARDGTVVHIEELGRP